jgi:hypothetical protein
MRKKCEIKQVERGIEFMKVGRRNGRRSGEQRRGFRPAI